MGLYPNLFNTCLLVQGHGARLHKNKTNFKINVLVRRYFYILDLPVDGSPPLYKDIITALKEIVIDAAEQPRNNTNISIGIITAAKNRTQFKAFKLLYKDKASKETVSLLSQSFLTLCLNIDSRPDSYSETAFYAHNTNHGNRWYHSSTQLVVFGNAKSALIFNFTAYIDGITMAWASYEFYTRAC